MQCVADTHGPQGTDDGDDDDSIVMCVVAKSERVTLMSDIREICYYPRPAIVRDAYGCLRPEVITASSRVARRGVVTDAYTNVDFGRRGRLGLRRYLRRPKNGPQRRSRRSRKLNKTSITGCVIGDDCTRPPTCAVYGTQQIRNLQPVHRLKVKSFPEPQGFIGLR